MTSEQNGASEAESGSSSIGGPESPALKPGMAPAPPPAGAVTVPERETNPLRKWVIRLALVFVLAAAAIFSFPWLVDHFTHEYTDDAQIDGTIVPIAVQVDGRVVELDVEEHQRVMKGQRLLKIDPADYQLTVEQKAATLKEAQGELVSIQAQIEVQRQALLEARATLETRQAQNHLATLQKDRYALLFKQNTVAETEFDQAEMQWKVSQAEMGSARAAIARIGAGIKQLETQITVQQSKIAQTEAELDTAQLNLQRTTLVAPFGGLIAKKNVDPGRYLEEGQMVMVIIKDSDIWVTANFKETQLEYIRLNQRVRIEVDAYPKATFVGHVDSFQPGTGAVFSLLPPENATGNYIKVVQRVPVKIAIDTPPDSARPLWPGMSVIPHVRSEVKARAHRWLAWLPQGGDSK